MKLKTLLLVLCMLGLVACRSNSCQSGIDVNKEKAADDVLYKVTARLKQETGLRPIGTMGQMLRQVEKLGLGFQYSKPVDIIEGRKLLLQAVNAMLDEVNQNARIRPYLYAYPFLPMDVEMEIFIRSPDGGDVPEGALCLVVAQDAALQYKIYNSTRRGFITVYRETFDQALERFADPSLPLVAFEPESEMSQEECAKHTMDAMTIKKNDYQEVMSVIYKYNKSLNKEYGIELRGYGLHYAGPDKIYDGKIHVVDLGYSIEKKMNFDEARTLFYTVVDGLLDALNEEESIRSYFFNPPVSYKDLFFTISFDYEYKGYLQKDNVSMIAILNNEIMYFIVEKDGGNAGLEMQQITPDVFIGTGLSPKTRCITRTLPETDAEKNLSR